MTFRKFLTCIALGFVAGLCIQENSQAQLIGNRNVGSAPGGIQQTTPGGRLGNRPSSFRTPAGGGGGFPQPNPAAGQQSAAGSNNPGGMARQDSRFIRGNRQKGDFVGTNRSDLQGFVGSTQAVGVGNVPIAANNVRIETGSRRANRALPPLGKSGMYYPKLDLSSILDDQDSELIPRPRQFEPLQERIRERTNPSVSIRMESGIVVLRGEVTSQRESELLETILGFEPGVDRIRNELVVLGR